MCMKDGQVCENETEILATLTEKVGLSCVICIYCQWKYTNMKN